MKIIRVSFLAWAMLVTTAHAQICAVQVARLDSGTAYGEYGSSVTIDNGVIVVGAPVDISTGGDGAVYVYSMSGASWTFVETLIPDEDSGGGFGSAVSIWSDVLAVGAEGDNTLAGTASSSGAVYVFEQQVDGMWSRAAKLLAPDGKGFNYLGGDNGVATDGNLVAGGARGNSTNGFAMGSAYMFPHTYEDAWEFQQELFGTPGGAFGSAVGISSGRVFIGAPGEAGLKGALYVFEQDEAGVWQQAAKLFASDGTTGDGFGTAIAASGNRLVIGAPYRQSGTGAAYVFDRDDDGTWFEQVELRATDAGSLKYFGVSVACAGDVVVAGSPNSYGHGASGGAYIFQRDASGQWIQQTKIGPSDGYAADGFGVSVALQGTTVVIGAPYNPALGENGGAVYIFELACGTPGCPGDLNSDGVVNLTDLATQLAHYGETSAPPEHGDLNGDGIIDLTDLAALLAVYGTICP